MINEIIKIVRSLYEYEGNLILDERKDGHKVIRVSTVLFITLSFLYIVSPIDLISELIVKPEFMGYMDDVFVTVLVLGYSYNDIKGVLTFEQDKVSDDGVCRDTESDREDEVPVPIRHDGSSTPTHNTNDSSTVDKCTELEKTFNKFSSSLGEQSDDNDDDSEDDAEGYDTK